MSLHHYDRVHLYYFTGTGNAFSVAQWIRQVVEQKGIPVELVNVATVDQDSLPHIPPNSLLGFIAPTHGFNFPPIMLK